MGNQLGSEQLSKNRENDVIVSGTTIQRHIIDVSGELLPDFSKESTQIVGFSADRRVVRGYCIHIVRDPDPFLFSPDPDPTCNNGYIKLFLS